MRFPIANPTIKNGTCLNVVQYWGENKELYLKNFSINGHNGLDFAYLNPEFLAGGISSYGQPILAAHDGAVSKMIWDSEHSTKGNGIYLKDLQGNETIYWHLSKILVVEQQLVSAGDKIGEMGSSGWVFPVPDLTNATTEDDKWGTHLHFGYRPANEPRNNGFDGFVDPLPFLIFNSKTMRYVIYKNKEQFLVDDVLKIAFNIGDEQERMILKERGLQGEPQTINSLIGYQIYPLVRSERLKDLFGL